MFLDLGTGYDHSGETTKQLKVEALGTIETLLIERF